MDEFDPGQGTVDAEFDVLYRGLFPGLMRVAFLMTGSNETAEDVVQEAFLACRSRLVGLEHPPSYLRASVINQCRSIYRRSRRRPVEPGPVADELPAELIELRDALCRLGW